MAVPPVDRFAVERRYTTSSLAGTVSVVAELLQQALGLVIEFQARQHFLVADAAARVRVNDVDEFGSIVCLPSPTTWPGMRFAAATSLPLTTSSR